MTSKIIVEPEKNHGWTPGKPHGWSAAFDESIHFVGYDFDEKENIVGFGISPEDAKIDLATQIACYATGDLKTALDELATDEIIRAALKKEEKRVVWYEGLFETAKHKEGIEHHISANRHAVEGLRNLISSMQEHTQ